MKNHRLVVFFMMFMLSGSLGAMNFLGHVTIINNSTKYIGVSWRSDPVLGDTRSCYQVLYPKGDYCRTPLLELPTKISVNELDPKRISVSYYTVDVNSANTELRYPEDFIKT